MFTTEPVQPNTVSRNEAMTQIIANARNAGYNGVFNVTYDGRVIASPSDLPESVDMTKIVLSEKLNQAAKVVKKAAKKVAKKATKKCSCK